MNRFGIWLACTALLATIAGCGSDTPVAPAETLLDQLAGTWQGESFIVSSNDNPQIALNLNEMGGSIALTFTSVGALSGVAVLPGAMAGVEGLLTIPLSGVVKVLDDTTLRIDFVPEIPPAFTTFTTSFTLGADRLEILDPNSSFDFDKDGLNEPATILGVLVRN